MSDGFEFDESQVSQDDILPQPVAGHQGQINIATRPTRETFSDMVKRCQQEGNKSGSDKSSNNLLESSDDEIEEFTQSQVRKEETVAAPAVTDLASKPRWPHFSKLIKNHPSICMALLQAVDDTDAQHEPHAKNAENLKDNKWANLRHITFGGERGSLVMSLPSIKKATDMKKKALEAWKHAKEHPDDPLIKKELRDVAMRQHQECLDAEKSVLEGKEASKRQNEALQASMASHERGKGAVPPGAKAIGAGRINHSTNLRLGRVSENLTPQRKKSTTPPSGSSGESSLTNDKASKDCDDFNKNFKPLADRIPGAKPDTPPGKKADSDSDAGLSPSKLEKKKKHQRQRKRHVKKLNECKDHIDADPMAKKEHSNGMKKAVDIDKKIDALYDDDSTDSRTTLGLGE